MENPPLKPDNAQPKKLEPVLAVSIFCMAEQKKIIEKLDEIREYITGLTEKEFEGRHEKNGVIVKIYNLQ